MKNLRTLKKYFARYKKKLSLGFLFIILSDAGTVYVPLLLKDAINEINKNTSQEALIRYALLIVGTSLIAGVFRFLIRQSIIVVSREIEFDVRQDFWKHIQLLPLRYFQNNSTGNIMAHATNDINAVRMFIGPAVMYSTDTALKLIIITIIMITLNPTLTLLALLPLPILSYAVYKVGKIIHDKFTLIQEKFSELTTKAQENYSGIRVVKSYVREESEVNQFNELSQDYLKKNMNMIKVQGLILPILILITGLSIIIVILYGGIKVINNEMNYGQITAFLIYLGMLIWPMIAFGWVVNIVQQAESSMRRLNKILSEPYEITESEVTDYNIKQVNGEIEFRNVSFRYKDGLPWILKDINLIVKQGQTIAIMGYTGSGKTSFVNLIPRLYDTIEGEVLIDGNNIRSMPLDVLRKNIGYVQQEAFLFSDSILNNITYGLREASLEKVKEVAAIANFDKDVESFPEKYNTVMGERGITLSGGQKQRASLARALAIDPKILILDDSFSAVDTHTEEEILKKLKQFMKNRTSIIISHRISTVKDADMIIVLADGKIAEQGTHDQLVQLNKIYADLHFKQLLENELEELN